MVNRSTKTIWLCIPEHWSKGEPRWAETKALRNPCTNLKNCSHNLNAPLRNLHRHSSFCCTKEAAKAPKRQQNWGLPVRQVHWVSDCWASFKHERLESNPESSNGKPGKLAGTTTLLPKKTSPKSPWQKTPTGKSRHNDLWNFYPMEESHREQKNLVPKNSFLPVIMNSKKSAAFHHGKMVIKSHWTTGSLSILERIHGYPLRFRKAVGSHLCSGIGRTRDPHGTGRIIRTICIVENRSDLANSKCVPSTKLTYPIPT